MDEDVLVQVVSDIVTFCQRWKLILNALIQGFYNQSLCTSPLCFFNPFTPACFACNLHKSNFAKISKNNYNAQ